LTLEAQKRVGVVVRASEQRIGELRPRADGYSET
jgi:hypothetical protein